MVEKGTSSLGRTRPSNLVQTLERASFILDILGQSPHGISIKDLSDRMGLPKGTTHRLVSSLSYFGYVRQDQNTKNYFLGFKLVELGNLLLGQLDLRREAEPFLRELAEQTRETVHLVILDGNEIVYLDKLETEPHTGGLRMASRVGSRNPAHSCAVGKVLMAYLPEGALARMVGENGLPKRTGNTITDFNQLKNHMTLVRKQGYAIDDEENERGIRCVGAPVFDEAGKVVAAISVSGPAFRVTKKNVQEKLKKEVMETALRISKRLGFRGRTWRLGLFEEALPAE
jgi:DNA-binding IclR family transcriptional regulator